MKVIFSIITIIVILIILMFVKNNKTPKSIGLKNGRLAPMSDKPNAVSSQTNVIDKRVEPLKFIGNLNNSKRLILDVINQFKNVTIIKNEKNYIYVVFASELMKYKDDVEFYFDENNKLIHFRSASRVGYSDMGVNRKRYDDIRKRYENKEIS